MWGPWGSVLYPGIEVIPARPPRDIKEDENQLIKMEINVWYKMHNMTVLTPGRPYIVIFRGTHCIPIRLDDNFAFTNNLVELL